MDFNDLPEELRGLAKEAAEHVMMHEKSRMLAQSCVEAVIAAEEPILTNVIQHVIEGCSALILNNDKFDTRMPDGGQETYMIVITLAELLGCIAYMMEHQEQIPKGVVIDAISMIAKADNDKRLKEAPPAGTA